MRIKYFKAKESIVQIEDKSQDKEIIQYGYLFNVTIK